MALPDDHLALQAQIHADQREAQALQIQGQRLDALREAATRHITLAGTIVAVAGLVLQFAEGRTARWLGASGIALSFLPFIVVVWYWNRLMQRHVGESNDAGTMTTLLRDLARPMKRQVWALSIELLLVALTLIVTLFAGAP